MTLMRQQTLIVLGCAALILLLLSAGERLSGWWQEVAGLAIMVGFALANEWLVRCPRCHRAPWRGGASRDGGWPRCRQCGLGWFEQPRDNRTA